MVHVLRQTSLLILFFLLGLGGIAGQTPQEKPRPALVYYAANGSPYLLELDQEQQSLPDQTLFRLRLGLNESEEMRPVRTDLDGLGQQHLIFQQYYQGIPVEFARYTLHKQGGRTLRMSGEYKRTQGLSTVPYISPQQAIEHAKIAIGAKKYLWEDPEAERQRMLQEQNPMASYYPSPHLVFVEDFRQQGVVKPLVLAYKLDIWAQDPLTHSDVYIDAQNGGLVFENQLIKDFVSTGCETRFSGNRTIETDMIGGPLRYRLAYPTRTRNSLTSNGVHVYNSERTSNFSTTEFTDLDNNWSAAEFNNANKDNAALDCYWGTGTSFDYWAEIHNRNSIDNNGARLISYVHYDDNPNDGQGMSNAFWNGSFMTYGDGGSGMQPFTSLDIVGHEIAHGLCQHTANLIYYSEPGALNEGFSDIWGACIERYAIARFGLTGNKDVWLCGEELYSTPGIGIRSLKNPKARNHPNTYGGQYWISNTVDNGGVHINSGVFNYWFYLLNLGGSGTNDLGYTYSITGISPNGNPATLHDAAKIAYRAETVYLTPNSGFLQARIATIQAAIDLFGSGSVQATTVAAAWDAVGVLDPGVASLITSFTPTNLGGNSGATITVLGKRLTGASQVTVSGTHATSFAVVNDSTLSLVVPNSISSGKIAIRTPISWALSPQELQILPVPTVDLCMPNAGPEGTEIFLSGTYFTPTTSVTVGGVPVTNLVYYNSTKLVGRVGLGTPTGVQSIVATTSSGSSNTNKTFNNTPAAPVITSVTPLVGPTAGGTLSKVYGQNFRLGTTATVAGLSASVTVLSPLELDVTIPPGTQGLSGPIAVNNGTGTATSANFLYTDPPQITLFTPTSEAPNTTTLMTIQGRNFVGTHTAVSIAGVPAPGVSVSNDSTLTVPIPVGQAGISGPVVVTTGAGTATSVSNFAYLDVPAIYSFSPNRGIAGTTVTVTGHKLSTTSAVTVGGVAVNNLTLINDQTLRFQVPTGANNALGVSVTNSQGAITSSGFQAQVAPLAGNVIGNPVSLARTNSTINLQFSEPISSSTASRARVFSAMKGGRKAGSWSGGGSSNLSFQANAPMARDFVPGEVVNLSIPPALTSVGNVPSKPQVFRFVAQTGGTGRGNFPQSTMVNSDASTTTCIFGDVDGDGDLDMMTTSLAGYYSLLYRNNGLGEFSSPTQVSVWGFCLEHAFGDVDGDGDLDYIYGNRYFNTVDIMLNGGNASGSNTGVFSARQAYNVNGSWPQSVAVNDFDGDGDLDIACVFRYSYKVALLKNNGSGTFTHTQDIPALVDANGVSVGDVDGDGDLDMVVGAGSNSYFQFSLMLNGGDATGSNTGVFTSSSITTTAQNPRPNLGDIDGDGDLDIVASSPSNGRITFFLNGGDGSGSNTGTFPTETVLFSSGVHYNTELGDVDADGDLDIVFPNTLRGNFSVRLNGGNSLGNGNGIFSGGANFAFAPGFADPFNVQLADIDGDMDLDVVVSAATIQAYFNSEPLPLPVEWISLSARYQAGGVQVCWSTASERNNDHFLIERSTDGEVYESIGQVAGAGNSTELKTYSFWDHNLPKGAEVLYYRLRQVDFDGKQHTSPSVTAKPQGADPELTLYPNPSAQYVSLEGFSGSGIISLSNSQGQEVWSKSIGSNEVIDISHLAPGVYFYRAMGQEQVFTGRLVRE